MEAEVAVLCSVVVVAIGIECVININIVNSIVREITPLLGKIIFVYFKRDR
jgi:hypothetical protein